MKRGPQKPWRSLRAEVRADSCRGPAWRRAIHIISGRMRLPHQTGFRNALAAQGTRRAPWQPGALLSSTENSHTPKKPIAMENSAGEA